LFLSLEKNNLKILMFATKKSSQRMNGFSASFFLASSLLFIKSIGRKDI